MSCASRLLPSGSLSRSSARLWPTSISRGFIHSETATAARPGWWSCKCFSSAAWAAQPRRALASNQLQQNEGVRYYRELGLLEHFERGCGPVHPVRGRGFLVDGLREQLDFLIREQQWRVAWENCVHGEFRGLAERNIESTQASLVLDLPDRQVRLPSARNPGTGARGSSACLSQPRVAEDAGARSERAVGPEADPARARKTCTLPTAT